MWDHMWVILNNENKPIQWYNDKFIAGGFEIDKTINLGTTRKLSSFYNLSL